MISEICSKANYNSSSNECNTSGNDGQVVEFWMTLITNPDGSPVMVNLMPDDDRDFTVIKGDWNELKRAGLGDLITVGSSSGLVNIRYGLTDMDEPSNTSKGLHGYLRDFPASLESVAVDGVIESMSFESTNSNISQDPTRTGPIRAVRRL